jgi:hypothetical protein
VQVLQEDCGVRYHDGFDPNPVAPPVFKTSKDLFLHGLVNDNHGGNCVSLPVVYTAVGRRLGYPIKLVGSREHVFCRWEGLEHPNPHWRTRFNFDGAGKGFSIDPDEFYVNWPKPSTPEEIKSHQWLESNSPSQELATFLLGRGHCLRHNARFEEAHIAYAEAYRFWPTTRLTQYWIERFDGIQRQAIARAELESILLDDAISPRIVSQRHSQRHWWETPQGREANMRQVQALNARNLRIMQGQVQSQRFDPTRLHHPNVPGINPDPSVHSFPRVQPPGQQ